MSQFTIYPAIDIRNGKCVQLTQGDYDQETIYREDPVEAAKEWEAQGARWIHLVDLDGAKDGRPINYETVGRIARSVDVPLQIGGGLREKAHVDLLFEQGVSRVILGTVIIEKPEFAEEVLQAYGDKVAIALDARDGYVATRGWLETSQVKAEDLALQLVAQGASTFIYTDIVRDGMMGGPNVEAIVQLAKVTEREVIASGGVSSQSDLLQLAQHLDDGVSGAIVGKAIYTGYIKLPEAMRALAAVKE